MFFKSIFASWAFIVSVSSEARQGLLEQWDRLIQKWSLEPPMVVKILLLRSREIWEGEIITTPWFLIFPRFLFVNEFTRHETAIPGSSVWSMESVVTTTTTTTTSSTTRRLRKAFEFNDEKLGHLKSTMTHSVSLSLTFSAETGFELSPF